MITMTAMVMITSQMIRTISQAELMKDFSSPEAGSTFVTFPLSPDFPGGPGGPGKPLGPGGPPGAPGIPTGPLGPGGPTGPCKKKETSNELFSHKDTLSESRKRQHIGYELQGGLEYLQEVQVDQVECSILTGVFDVFFHYVNLSQIM